ncbi:MAG TPA: hypothetical protein VJZ52_02135 [Candidatus Paceibacterota bacterium]|nr:hypothetical protein [Candidatus Paceibacterota bacterium]
MSKMILETIFGSRARVRLLKFLFRNYPNAFSVKEITRHLQEDPTAVKREVADFIQIGLLIKGNKQNEKIKTKVS